MICQGHFHQMFVWSPGRRTKNHSQSLSSQLMPTPAFNWSALQPVSNSACTIVHNPLSLRRSKIKLQNQRRCRQDTLSLSNVPRSIVCSISLQCCHVCSALSSSWHLIPPIVNRSTLRPAMCSTNPAGKYLLLKGSTIPFRSIHTGSSAISSVCRRHTVSPNVIPSIGGQVDGTGKHKH